MRLATKSIGELNGGWKAGLKFALMLFPALCAVAGYSAIVLRDHDQRIMSMESVAHERLMMVDDFRRLRDQVPVQIAELIVEAKGIKAAIIDLKEGQSEAKQDRADLRKLVEQLRP